MTKWLKHDKKFRYMMLDRLRGDCEYYLDYGRRNAKALWALDETEQIQTMIDIWNTFSEEDKPEWLTWEDIKKYAEGLGVDI